MVIYKDKTLYEKLVSRPGLFLDADHPCVKMRRYAKDDKSIFKIGEQDAIKMYAYYKDAWGCEVVDEFGENIFDFKEVLAGSYCEENLKLTIRQLFDAREVEKKLLKNLTQKKEE